MVTATLSEDRKWIYVDGNIDEISNIRLDFTKKINSWFIIKKNTTRIERKSQGKE